MKHKVAPGTSGQTGFALGGCFSFLIMAITFVIGFGIGFWLL